MSQNAMELDDARLVGNLDKKKGSTGVTRFHVSFPQTLHEKLLAMQQETHAATLTEVLKDSLKVYAYMLDAEKNGKEIIIRDKNGGRETIIPLFL